MKQANGKKRTVEHTQKPFWDVDLREQIYNHLRASWRERSFNSDDALWHLNEAIALLYVAHCPSEVHHG